VPPFPRPRFDFVYDFARERAALKAYRRDKPGRQIPAKAKGRLLIGTWNVANLGVQDRLDSDYALIAEVIGWFDLVAVQEVNDDLRGIQAIHDHLPSRYDLLFSDASGNRERQAFLYDSRKVKRLREVGRIAIPPSQLPRIARQGTTTPFTGFDRGPYLASFEAGGFRFALLNVHLFFGSAAPEDLDRRTLETFAVAWWADRTHRDANSYVSEIVPLGDFNLLAPRRATGSSTPSSPSASRRRRTAPRSAPRSPPTTSTTRSRSSQGRRKTGSPARAASSTSTVRSSRTSGPRGRSPSSSAMSGTTSRITGRCGSSSRPAEIASGRSP
jgi:endonuclease/exonuclease/phosphatase family metal-dependent hydrolase